MEFIVVPETKRTEYHAYISKRSNGVFTAFNKDPKTDISPIVDGVPKEERAQILLYLIDNYILYNKTSRDNITELIDILNTKYKPSNIEDFNYTIKKTMYDNEMKIDKISKHIDPVITFMDLYGKDMRGTSFGGSIDIKKVKLESLLGCPEEMSGTLDISKTKIKSLVGAPKKVRHLQCDGNAIVDLEGCPEISGWGHFVGCKKLVSLKGATVIGEAIDLSKTGFKSKEDIIKEIVKYKLSPNMIHTDFGMISDAEIDEIRQKQKLGKFKDFLDL